jgi:hypothetical protein
MNSSDGTYSAAEIVCGQFEKGSCEKHLDDIAKGKALSIGQLKCYTKDGEYKIYKNLTAKKTNK